MPKKPQRKKNEWLPNLIRVVAGLGGCLILAAVAYFTRSYWWPLQEASVAAIQGATETPQKKAAPKPPGPPPPPPKVEVPADHQAEVGALFAKGAAKLRVSPFVTTNLETGARYRKWAFVSYSNVRPMFRATRRSGAIEERVELDFNAAGKQSPPAPRKGDAESFDVRQSGNGFQVKYRLKLIYNGHWQLDRAQWNYATLDRYVDVEPDSAHRDFIAWLLELILPQPTEEEADGDEPPSDEEESVD